KCIPFWIKDENGLPSRPHQLLLARNVLSSGEVKFFLSNAPESTPVDTLLLVAFSRWRIERCFEDGKTELGLDHFEVRQWLSISRHLILTAVSHLFLAEFRKEHRGEKSGPDGRPGPHRHTRPDAAVVPRRPLLAPAGRRDRRATGVNAGPQRRLPTLASQANAAALTRDGHHLEYPDNVPMARNVAL
ncbi:MAG: hypothetical protein ACRD3R_07250, partial [Terriglobales bacterium]